MRGQVQETLVQVLLKTYNESHPCSIENPHVHNSRLRPGRYHVYIQGPQGFPNNSLGAPIAQHQINEYMRIHTYILDPLGSKTGGYSSVQPKP